MNFKDKDYTIRQFNADFPDDAACLQYLFEQQFPKGCKCDHCGKTGKFYPVAKRKTMVCSCGKTHISPTAHTVFHKSSTPLRLWFHAMFLMTASRNGVSAMELMRQIGVTYKTAWRMNHQIRILMNEKLAKFTGTIEADEAYIGGKNKKKTAVIGVLQRGGNIAVKTVPNVKTDSLIKNIDKVAQRGATVMTDELQSYKQLPTIGFPHQTVNHSQGSYVNGDIHTNGIESFWAQLKRSLHGTYHHVSAKYLQCYLNEFAYRHNHRHSAVPMFERLTALAHVPHGPII